MIPVRRFTRRSNGTDGQTLTGWRAEAREFLLPLRIISKDWLPTARRFFRTIRPDVPGTLVVITDDGQRFEIQLHYDDDDDRTYDIDPTILGNEPYDLPMVADDPWWRGTPVKRTFLANTAAPTYLSTDSGAVYRIGSSFTSALAAIDNPGDVPAWLKWRAVGPLASFSAGVGDDVIARTAAIASGRTLTIDTDPRAQVAVWEDGTLEPLANFTSVDFAPVAPGTEVPLAVAQSGAGRVIAELSPQYFRVW